MNCGDLTFLKSGGPLMTVRSIIGQSVEVDWFIDDELCRDTFRLAQLLPFEPPMAGEPAWPSKPTLVRDNDR